MKYMTDTHYTCAICDQMFEKGLTDDEAEEQFHREFPGTPYEMDALCLVCDDCFKIMKENSLE